jgi:type IV secretory pathway TraG/TraD family ATPase VirD4
LATFIGQAVNELRIDDQSQDLAPVGFVLDEAANVPLVGLKEIAGVGRGRRIGLILGYQNLPQVHDQYGQEGGNAILGSIGTTIFLPGLDDVTSQFASGRIGQTTVWSHTTVDGKGKKLDNERQSETGRALMDQTEVRQMVKHCQCVVVIDTSPPIKASYPPYAVLRQRAIAVDYGEPRLVSLIDAEEAFLRKVQAKMQTELLSAELMEDESVRGDVLEQEQPVSKNDDAEKSSAISSKGVGKADGRRRKEPKGEEDTEKDYAQRGLFETEVVQREFCNSAAAVYTDGITRVDEAALANGVGTDSQHNDSVR